MTFCYVCMGKQIIQADESCTHKTRFLCISELCSQEKSRQFSMAYKLRFCHEFIIGEKLAASAGTGTASTKLKAWTWLRSWTTRPQKGAKTSINVLDHFHLKSDFQLFSPLACNPIVLQISAHTNLLNFLSCLPSKYICIGKKACPLLVLAPGTAAGGHLLLSGMAIHPSVFLCYS